MFASGARAAIARLDRDGPDALDAIRAELEEMEHIIWPAAGGGEEIDPDVVA